MVLNYQNGDYRLDAPYGAKHEIMLAVARGQWESFYGVVDRKPELLAPVALHVVIQP